MKETVFYVIGYFLVAISFIPLIRNDNWIFRIFEYPRVQKLFLTVLTAVLFVGIVGVNSTGEIALVVTLTLNSIYLAGQIWPYTRMAKNQMKRNEPGKTADISLLICNVFQDNQKYSSLLRLIQKCDPDMVLLVETDQRWKNNLQLLEKKYTFSVMKPMDNTYGMLLYSKLELLDPKINFLIEKDVPSIQTKVRLSSGEVIMLYCLHPEPPVPTENPRSTERDAEILLVGKQAKNSTLPVIVAGDLNDVAWSYTTELFLKTSGLLDPRRGRGFYNTFHVRHPFWRWPLDHVFCSEHFFLSSLERLPDMGSDHFPIFIALTLSKKSASKNRKDKLHATPGEKALAKEKISRK
jgi:endonuclease/exonuclease/phosphatase (EEP) superfamily protein YafD